MTTRLFGIATFIAVAAFLLGASEPSNPHAGTTTFETSNRCVACHNGVTTSQGEDVSIGYEWRASMMANSARDPYWQASVRREILDHPSASEAIQDECARCHMPMARATAAGEARRGEVFAHLPIGENDTDESRLAADGVSCTLCHQISADRLGDSASQSGRFRLDTLRRVFGPFEIDSGRRRIMHSASSFVPTEGRHVQTSELCASCHTLRTEGLGAAAGFSLPEQTPYLEWKASAFAGKQTCQSCHMPEVGEDVPVAAVLGQPRRNVSRHVFRGGNFFMLRMLSRHRNELGVVALPQELNAAVAAAVDHLQLSTAKVDVRNATIESGRLFADVVVTNLAGHKLPTAYPSRRAWLHVVVRDARGATIFESGAFSADGSIAGNDNDRDAVAVEPHYQSIDRAEQVQIYESVMADAQGRPTTGLLSAVRFVKDNRLLPDGFDRAAGGADVAVRGDAERDADFVGGSDRVRYSVEIGDRSGPFTVSAELWYQPIAFRWARNLATYDAPETRRFATWYAEMAASSALVLARGSASGIR